MSDKNKSTEMHKGLGSLTEPTPATGKPLDGFVFMDEVGKILDVAMTTQKNVILYGPGGYGKSEFSIEFLREKGIDPYVITMGTGMTTDRLFGGLDLPVFNTTGKLEYLVENSFMNHEYVIFEELFDAPDFILEQLKDILSSGVFRNGGQMFPIKTKFIICCTNKTREEFSKNDSLKALMERFPLEMKVVWKDHNRITYEKLFVAKTGTADPMLTYVLEQYAKAGTVISPRIALVALDIIGIHGGDSLVYLAGFNSKPDLLKTSVQKFKSIMEVKDLVDHMNEILDDYSKCDLTSLEGIKEAGRLNRLLNAEIVKLKSIKADDSVVADANEAVKRFTKIHDTNKQNIAAIVESDGAPVGS